MLCVGYYISKKKSNDKKRKNDGNRNKGKKEDIIKEDIAFLLLAFFYQKRDQPLSLRFRRYIVCFIEQLLKVLRYSEEHLSLSYALG
jgi:hypothetical protein